MNKDKMKQKEMIEKLQALFQRLFVGTYTPDELEQYEALTQAIDQLRWRSVETELPEDDVRVLCIVNGCVDIGIHSYCDGEWLWMFTSGWSTDVEQWRPITPPEQP